MKVSVYSQETGDILQRNAELSDVCLKVELLDAQYNLNRFGRFWALIEEGKPHCRLLMIDTGGE